MAAKIPRWIDPDKDYSLMSLVNKGVFPNMTHYVTVLHNLIETDIIKHRTIKRFDANGKEKVYGRRYFVKGWSLIEYLGKHNEGNSQVIEIRKSKRPRKAREKTSRANSSKQLTLLKGD